MERRERLFVDSLDDDSARQDEPVCLVGLKIHILVEGWAFDIATRTALARL